MFYNYVVVFDDYDNGYGENFLYVLMFIFFLKLYIILILNFFWVLF